MPQRALAVLPAQDADPFTKEGMLALWHQWKVTNNQDAFALLYERLRVIAADVARIYHAKYPWISERYFFEEICLPKLDDFFKYYNATRPDHKSPDAFTYTILTRQCLDFARRNKRSRALQKTGSLDAPFDPSDPKSSSLLDVLKDESVRTNPEMTGIHDELRDRVAALCRAASVTLLNPRDHIILEFFLQGRDTADVANLLGVSGTAIRFRLARVRKKLAGVFVDMDRLPRADAFLFRHFFPHLDSVSARKKILDAGIFLNENGTVHLGTPEQENAFPVRVFPAAQPGSFISGFDILKAAETSSLRTYLTDRMTDPSDLVDNPDTADAEKASDNHLMDVRTVTNFSKMCEIFHIFLDVDGKWSVEVPTKVFHTSWCCYKDRMVTGGFLLKLFGICAKTGTVGGQPEIQQFCEMFFAPEPIKFIQSQRGGGMWHERMSPARLIAELTAPDNLAVLASCGITLQDDQCLVRTKMEQLGKKTADGPKLRIGKKRVTVYRVFELFGLPLNQPGLQALCEKFFPGKKIVFLQYANGKSKEPDPLFTPDAVLAQMKLPANLALLRSVATALPDGRLAVDLDGYDFMGIIFSIHGRKKGIDSLMACFELIPSQRSIVWLYREIFGEDQIVVDPDRSAFHERVQHYLLNDFFPASGIVQDAAGRYILPRFFSRRLFASDAFLFEGKNYSIRSLTSRCLGPERKTSKIRDAASLLSLILDQPVIAL